jgi:hypothetical protein
MLISTHSRIYSGFFFRLVLVELAGFSEPEEQLLESYLRSFMFLMTMSKKSRSAMCR